VGPDGYPRSWRHFRLGADVIAREHAREQLRLYAAVGATQAIDKKERQGFHDRATRLAGW